MVLVYGEHCITGGLIDDMPKRKRSGQSSVHAELEKYQDEVFRALKASKGFERQRLSKRLRDPGITQDKVHRLEKEIAVLKVNAWRSPESAIA